MPERSTTLLTLTPDGAEAWSTVISNDNPAPSGLAISEEGFIFVTFPIEHDSSNREIITQKYTPDGTHVWEDTYTLDDTESIIDVATRYIVGSQFRLSEGCVDHEAVFEQALRVHGRPRTYYVDRGAAYVSGSLRSICADLEIHLQHTQTREAEAKGAIERWHRTWRAEVGVEVEGGSFDLAELNAVHSAWLGREYHAREHSTMGKVPRTHLLDEVAEGHLRPLPTSMNIDEVFWHRTRRVVRRDNTIDLGGRRYEVSTMGLAGRRVEVRFDPRDPDVPPKVFADDGFLCDTRPLDMYANAHRPRRRKAATIDPPVQDPVHVVQDLLDEHFGPENTEGEVEG